MKQRLTPEQWDIISCSEEFWRGNGYFPSIEELAEDTRLTVKKVEEILFDPIVKKHLEIRGIDWNVNTPPLDSSSGERRKGKEARLSDIQLATAATLLNPLDKRTTKAKLESLGVAYGTYAGWKKNASFRNYMKSQGAALFDEYTPDMENALISQATSGDVRAIKFAFEVSGRYRPQQTEEIADVKLLMIQLIEIIQRHVTDPLTLQNIAQDVQALQQGAIVSGNNQQTRAISPSRD